MQVDMHFYGVYCLARAAGMMKNAAVTIAYASQYVDDSNIQEITTHDNGSKAISEATAHHTTDIKNIDRNDQRYIWVPFHFFPGGEGNAFTERLICRKDSSMVNEMLLNHMNSNSPYILELMGIATHVYADTFAHYGFSGVSSRRNRIVGDSLKCHNIPTPMIMNFNEKVAKWFGKYGEQGGLLQNIRTLISEGAELATGALGHGGVSIYPDQPYLAWEFEYEYITPSLEEISVRDNKDTYLEACLKIYRMFVRFLEIRPEYKDDAAKVKLEKRTEVLRDILAFEGGKEERIRKWRRYGENAQICNVKETMPTYKADSWHNQYNQFSKLTQHKDFANMNIYRFFQAASYHKHYVLRELLPSKGIIVI